MAFSVKTRGRTAYKIYVLARGDDGHEQLEWRYLDEHLTHSRAAVALDEWLHENDCLPGRYRADSPDGYSTTRTYEGEESL